MNYPKVFGGTWSTSPDPSDFHDFTGVDLYAPQANMFHTADGLARPLVREQGKVVAMVEQFRAWKRWLEPKAGQLNSLIGYFAAWRKRLASADV